MAWYLNCSVHNRKDLQRVVKKAENISGTVLPLIQKIYSKQCLKKDRSIIKDPTHTNHELFLFLTLGQTVSEHEI